MYPHYQPPALSASYQPCDTQSYGSHAPYGHYYEQCDTDRYDAYAPSHAYVYANACAPTQDPASYSPSACDTTAPGPLSSYTPSPATCLPQQDTSCYENTAQRWDQSAHPHSHPQHSQSYSPALVSPTPVQHDDRRGSTSSVATTSTQWTQDYDDSGDYYAPERPAPVQQTSYHHVPPVQPAPNEFDHRYQQVQEHHTSSQHLPDDTRQPLYGMYSPRQYAHQQQLAQNAHYDQSWTADTDIPEHGLGLQQAQYGSLPLSPEHQTNAGYERASTQDVTHQLCYPAQQPQQSASPRFHPSPRSSYLDQSSPLSQTSSEASPAEAPRDLFVQQRRAYGYQRELQHKQELKRQHSEDFEELEANQRLRLNSYSVQGDHVYAVEADRAYTLAHSSAPEHCPAASSASQPPPRPVPILTPPIVPSQAHERTSAPGSHTGPAQDDKKDSAPKKPALACLFCRKRKIACGPPPPDHPDRTCNQCLRRKQPCEYPTESRRGIRKNKEQSAASASATETASASEEPTVRFVPSDVGQPPQEEPSASTSRGRGRRKRTD